MEVNFVGSSLKYEERIGELTFTCEETAELVVPDALPDVSEILMADGQSFLRGKEAKKNALVVSGLSEVTVLYCAEDGDLRKLRLEMPFAGENACAGLTETDWLSASVCLMSAEARILNSRKVAVKTEISIRVSAWSPRMLEWAKDAPETETLELKKETCVAFPVTEVTEKTFEVSDTLPLPAGKPPVGEILYSRAGIQQEEANPVGGRLILRGTAFLSVVYLSLSGETAEADLRMPWSAVLDAASDGEEQSCAVELALTGLHTELNEGGISVDLGGVAQAEVYTRTELCYLTDAYSTAFALTPETQTAKLTGACKRSEQTDVLTLHLEGRQPPRSLTAIFACCGRPRQEKELCRVPVTVKALCAGEDGKTILLTGQGEAVCRGMMNPGFRTGELYASVSSGGAEVRVPVIFSGMQEEIKTLTLLTGAAAEDAPQETGEFTAVLLRTRPGDTVWELGKRKRLPCAAIRSVNGLESDEEPAPGTLLLLAK